MGVTTMVLNNNIGEVQKTKNLGESRGFIVLFPIS